MTNSSKNCFCFSYLVEKFNYVLITSGPFNTGRGSHVVLRRWVALHYPLGHRPSRHHQGHRAQHPSGEVQRLPRNREVVGSIPVVIICQEDRIFFCAIKKSLIAA